MSSYLILDDYLSMGQMSCSYRYKGGKGGSVKAPEPVAAAATPTEIDENVRRKNMDKRRQRIMAAGRSGTILNQGESLAGNATLLGRSTQ